MNVIGFLRKRLGRDSAPEGVREDEIIEALHDEFCRTFCHRPGVNFMQFLKDERVTNMIAWLRPETACALPKGFIRLAVDSTRKGYKIWEQPGINLVYDGNWTESGGLPPQESLDALSVLAQILQKPIKLHYTQSEGGELMLMEFAP